MVKKFFLLSKQVQITLKKLIFKHSQTDVGAHKKAT